MGLKVEGRLIGVYGFVAFQSTWVGPLSCLNLYVLACCDLRCRSSFWRLELMVYGRVPTVQVQPRSLDSTGL